MTMYQIYCRMLGYVVTLVLHVGNASYMSTCFNGEVMKNAHVKHFSEMQLYFFTCWTFTFQIIYAAIALYSDILTIKSINHRGYQLPRMVRNFRDTFFISFVWPATVTVSTLFWSFWCYDRNLLYPEDIDLAIPSTCNHIMHSWIFFILLWETKFRPRTPPRSHIPYLLIALGLEIVYFATILGVYYFKGKYVYPMFGHLIGTKYFYIFFGLVTITLVIIYYAQWVLNDFLWGSEVRRSKKSVKWINSGEQTKENTTRKIQ